ncbi:alpha/beta hydrolase [Clostridium tertium]|uniref:alpha/beta hydrolase n=1 Tax=Clostridium tertium TaxID=1559 RepID=UPI00241E1FB8|nr:alpha/beta hydrolase [Clostridium tertium]
MKKFLKVIGIVILVVVIAGGVFIYSIRDRISLYTSVLKKYSEFAENGQNLTEDLSLKSIDSIDYDDIIYKNTNGTSLTLDIYGPKKNEIPEAISPLLDAFREEGFTIISTSYELMNGEENFSKQISDVKDTIRWIHKNKDDFGFNADRIGVIGASSGAHLALMAAYSAEDQFVDSQELKDYPSNIKYLIDFFGPTDLTTLDISNVQWDLEQIINSVGEQREDILKLYSPVNYVDKNEPNTLIVHSKQDNTVPYENAEILYDELKEKGNKAELITLEGASHDFSQINIDEIVSVGIKMLEFIAKNM